jgi:hypothetical protein
MARVIIMADHHTKRRVVARVDLLEQVIPLMHDLNATLGGSWIQVQELKPYEVVPFEAAKDYHGFDNNPEDDYCGNLILLRKIEYIRSHPVVDFPGMVQRFVHPANGYITSDSKCLACGKKYSEHGLLDVCPI